MAGVGREGGEGGKGGGLGTEGEGSMGGKGGEGGVEEQESYGVGQYTATALVSTVCHAPLAWNSRSMFFCFRGGKAGAGEGGRTKVGEGEGGR